jgi:terminase, large subunit
MPAPRTITVVGSPSWLPKSLKRRQAEIRVRVRFSAGERQVLRKRERIQVSRWAEKHRVITKGPFAGGRYRHDAAVYLAGIMDASFFPSVQEIIMVASPQTGKSTVIDTCIGYAMDRAPGDTLYVYPDEGTTKENIRDRLNTMIRASTRLRGYLTGAADDEGLRRITLTHMSIYAGWATSSTSLANKTVRYGIADEEEKFPTTSGKKESGPVDLIRARLRWYQRFGGKIWRASTPNVEAGSLWRAFQHEAQVRFDFQPCCPDCGGIHRMAFENIRWDKIAVEQDDGSTREEHPDPETMETDHLAYYVCPLCGCMWDDAARDKAIRGGRWVAREDGRRLNQYLGSEKPRKIAFHMPAWISWLVSLSEIAAAWIRYLHTHDKNKLKDFKNKYEAVPWLAVESEREETHILALRDDRPRGLVPGDGQVSCLLAAADVHGETKGIWYEIRAFGWGLGLESWQVREGNVLDFESLSQVLFSDEYLDAAGLAYTVRMAGIDAQYRTSEVYDFCRRHPGRAFPVKGEQQMAQPIAWSKVDVYPGTNKPVPGGLKRLRVDTSYFKNMLAGRLEISPADPGAWHLHRDCSTSWARQLCSEALDDQGIWTKIGDRKNEAWDIGVYILALSHVLGVQFWKTAAPKKRTTQKEKTGGWLPEKPKSGWLP